MAANRPVHRKNSRQRPPTSSRKSPIRPDEFREVAGQAEDFAGRVAHQGREAANRMQEVAGNVKGAVDKSIKDQPMATLAVSAVLGFVLGALCKS
jgi:ElaB/YqjD/DUF883 family membrane-anchored ribosome-binding protein